MNWKVIEIVMTLRYILNNLEKIESGCMSRVGLSYFINSFS